MKQECAMRALARRFSSSIATLGLLVCVVGQVEAGPIIIPGPYTGTTQILQASPIGQTFTAEDQRIQSVGFSVHDSNPTLGPSDFSLTISLYAGIGTAGALLGDRTFLGLTDGFDGFIDVDFTSVSLNVGDIYTAIIGDTTPRWGLNSVSVDVYAGGTAIQLGEPSPFFDFGLRVIPVSEPATSALLATGILALALYRRRAALPARCRRSIRSCTWRTSIPTGTAPA